MREDVLAELDNPEIHRHKIKKRCGKCGDKIPGTWEEYRVRGNYCHRCSGEHRGRIPSLPKKLLMTEKAIKQREYRRRNIKRVRAYNKEYMRRRRAKLKKVEKRK